MGDCKTVEAAGCFLGEARGAIYRGRTADGPPSVFWAEGSRGAISAAWTAAGGTNGRPDTNGRPEGERERGRDPAGFWPAGRGGALGAAPITRGGGGSKGEARTLLMRAAAPLASRERAAVCGGWLRWERARRGAGQTARL